MLTYGWQEYGMHEYHKLAIIWTRVWFEFLKNSRQTIHWSRVWCRFWKTWRPLSPIWFFIHWRNCTRVHSFIHLNHRAPFSRQLTTLLVNRAFREILSMSKRKKQRCEKNVGISAIWVPYDAIMQKQEFHRLP